MPKAIKAGFDELQARLTISDLQTSTISTRQSNVRDAVRSEFKTLDDFLTGSYARSTMIAPLADADIDIFFVLDPAYYKKYSATALLDRTRTVLLRTYTKTPAISRSGQAVTITFSDFKVDVVMGYYRAEGGYLIANSITDQYLATDPKKHVELWSASNKEHSGMLVPLLKMLKGWNRKNGELLRSFHLETMCRAAYKGGTIGNYPGAVKEFFRVASAFLSVVDPAGYGGDVGAYLSKSDREGVVSRFETALKRTTDALDYDSGGKVEAAYERWRLVFGDYFPAYG